MAVAPCGGGRSPLTEWAYICIGAPMAKAGMLMEFNAYGIVKLSIRLREVSW